MVVMMEEFMILWYFPKFGKDLVEESEDLHLEALQSKMKFMNLWKWLCVAPLSKDMDKQKTQELLLLKSFKIQLLVMLEQLW